MNYNCVPHWSGNRQRSRHLFGPFAIGQANRPARSGRVGRFVRWPSTPGRCQVTTVRQPTPGPSGRDPTLPLSAPRSTGSRHGLVELVGLHAAPGARTPGDERRTNLLDPGACQPRSPRRFIPATTRHPRSAADADGDRGGTEPSWVGWRKPEEHIRRMLSHHNAEANNDADQQRADRCQVSAPPRDERRVARQGATHATGSGAFGRPPSRAVVGYLAPAAPSGTSPSVTDQ